MAKHFESVLHVTLYSQPRRERERETHSLGFLFLLMAVYFVWADTFTWHVRVLAVLT